jgi:hypothetical protein
MRTQLRAYQDGSAHDHWPDAYLATEQIVEEALQRVAAGARSARVAGGLPSADPAGREDRLAKALTDNPRISLALEAARYPRPLLPAPPGERSPAWAEVAAVAQGTQPPTTLLSAKAEDGMLMASVGVQPVNAATTVVGGSCDGWIIVGIAERLACKPRRHTDRTPRAYRYRSLEIRRVGDLEGLESRPLAAGDIAQWTDPAPSPLSYIPAALEPLLAIDHPGDAVRGLGLPVQVLTPTTLLISTLGLRPGKPMTLDDDAGPGLTLITWRTCYKRSDYHIAWPRLTGCAVVIRPDLMPRIADRLQANLVMRDFIAADEALAETDRRDA